MRFPSSYSAESPIAPFIIAAVVVGLVLGALTVWRVSVGALWFSIIELAFPLGVVAVFVIPDLRAQRDIGFSLLLASVPCVYFLLYSVATAALVALPGCIIRALVSRRHGFSTVSRTGQSSG